MNAPMTLAQSIAHIDPSTGDRRIERLSHADALKQLTIAVENFINASRRFSFSLGATREEARANAVGSEVRLMAAFEEAKLALATPPMGDNEFIERRAS